MVLDASITIAWVYATERAAEVERVFARAAREHAWVPSLWHLEVANVLQMNTVRGKNDPAFRDQTLNNLRNLLVLTDAETEIHAWRRTLQVAEMYRLTLYDAA